MTSGKDITAKAEKHELRVWDCRLATFHTSHKADNQKMASSYNIGYILACGNALHVKYNILRAEAKLKGEVFSTDVNTWTKDEEVKELTEYFQKEEVGQLITRLSIVRSTVLKSTFGTADVDNYKAAFYEDKPSFEAAMKMSIGDNLTESNKLIINKWRDAAFPLNKDDGAAHKEALRAILYAPEINDFMTGVPWATVSELSLYTSPSPRD